MGVCDDGSTTRRQEKIFAEVGAVGACPPMILVVESGTGLQVVMIWVVRV